MADDTIFIIIGFAGLLFAVLGWVIGRVFDTHFRAKIMRSITKKDYGLIGLIGKDSRTIRFLMINFDQDLVQVGAHVWIADHKRIYRQDKPERGFFADSESTPKKFSEGVPIIYVNSDDLKPVDFFREEGGVTSVEMNGWLSAWVTNQMMKGQAFFKQQQLMLLVLFVVVAVVGLIAFKALEAADAARQSAVATQAQVAEIYKVIAPNRIQVMNGTGVLN